MESNESLWLIPISVIPGLGMLVLSTSARYMTVALQLREQGKETNPDLWLAELIFKRASCLQKALLALYLSIAAFIIASLLGVIMGDSDQIVLLSKWIMLGGGIFAMYSSIHLGYEILFSRKILRRDYENLQRSHNK